MLPLVLAGCGSGAQWGRFGLPEGVTNEAGIVSSLWRGAWIAALAVGVVVWGLTLAAAFFFRRRRGNTELPPQVRYNLPIEVLYTSTPILMVLVYFFFTARDEARLLDIEENRPAHTVNVVGKRWSWDFNYLEEGVYETGTTGEPPVLVLPRGERVQFDLESRDVIHSFWVVPFLFKLDTIPGRVNSFQVVPEKTGTFAGKCAELCGQDHARMLFTTRIVEPAEYRAYIDQLRARGQTGRLGAEDLGVKRYSEAQTEGEGRQ